MTLNTQRIIEPESLNAASFAPFGEVIHPSTAKKEWAINDGNTTRFHDVANLVPGDGGRVIASIFRAQPRELPFTVTMMERHPLASQAFIPLSGLPWLVVVAPPGSAPQAADLRLFVCRPNQGVNYAPGVWHHPILALDAVSDFLVLDRDGPGDNCDIITLDEPAVILPVLSQGR